MLEIGNRKFRNMQEQVGFNTEQINNILAVLDGLNIQDNVVVVDDISNPLTAEEMEVVNREVAFIIYNNQLYIKKSKDSTYAYFDVVFSISGTTTISFTSAEITVALSNGALGYSTNTKSTYSTSQLDTSIGAKADTTYVDSQLATKANLSGASFTGAISSPSITEINTGYTWTKVNNVTWSDVYVGICKTGNKLTIVVFGNYTYTAGDSLFLMGRIYLPATVGAKLYPYTQGLSTDLLSRDVVELFDDSENSPAPKEACFDLQKVADTQINLNGRRFADAGLTAGKTYNFRFERTFLLSDNLAS